MLHTLIQSYKRTLFNIIFLSMRSDNIEMNCRLDLCIYMDNSLVVFFGKVSFTSSFFG